MYTFHILFFALTVSIVKSATAINCNGLSELCDLRIDQTTFPGSHNSGAGFDGLLKYGSGILAASCFYRNQGKSFSGQLEFGIRYFDVDTCYRRNKVVNCHCSESGGCAYTGSMEKGLSQIDMWMNSHANEVIIIHFNNNAQNSYRDKIAKSLEKLLLKLWKPNSSGTLAMNTHYRTIWKWPTLGDAILLNQRIFIFMDNNLSQHIYRRYNWLVRSNGVIRSTWDTNSVSIRCSGITTNAKKKCSQYSDFTDLSAFGSYGLCTWDMATVCSKWLGEAEEECYRVRERIGKTVNFLLVDWIDYYHGKESVINKAKFMNQKNVKKYLGKSIFFPELTGCSYHSSWEGKYCYKYCAKYGWCWINQHCGDNADVCKKKDYQCHSSCEY